MSVGSVSSERPEINLRRGTFFPDLTLIHMPVSKSGRASAPRHQENAMSDKSIPFIVTVATIVLMFGWGQLLNFACPHWSRALRRGLKKMKRGRRKGPSSVTSYRTIQAQAAPVSSLSSRSLADQSRDLLQAISAGGKRVVSHPRSTIPSIHSVAE